MSDTSGPAFPHALTIENEYVGSEGMSLRDYFAGQVLVGIWANSAYLMAAKNRLQTKDIPLSRLTASVAQDAYEMADAMLNARNSDRQVSAKQ